MGEEENGTWKGMVEKGKGNWSPDGWAGSALPEMWLPLAIIAVAVLGLSVWGAVKHGFVLGAFNRNNYRFPTTNHTMQVFGSDA